MRPASFYNALRVWRSEAERAGTSTQSALCGLLYTLLIESLLCAATPQDTGSKPQIMQLFERFRKSGTGAQRLQVLMFSATLHSPRIADLSARICENPIWVDLKVGSETNIPRPALPLLLPCSANADFTQRFPATLPSRQLIAVISLVDWNELRRACIRIYRPQGVDTVPEGVRHAYVLVDPEARPDWSALQPAALTDRCHALERFGDSPLATDEGKSEAVKRLKPHVLREVIDHFKMERAIVFCRTNFDCENLVGFLNAAGGGRRAGAFTGRAPAPRAAACRLR